MTNRFLILVAVLLAPSFAWAGPFASQSTAPRYKRLSTHLSGSSPCNAALVLLMASLENGECAHSNVSCSTGCSDLISQVCSECKDGDTVIVEGRPFTYYSVEVVYGFMSYVPDTKCQSHFACLEGPPCSAAFTELELSLLYGDCRTANISCNPSCSASIDQVCSKCQDGVSLGSPSLGNYSAELVQAIIVQEVPAILCPLACLVKCGDAYYNLQKSLAPFGDCVASTVECSAKCNATITEVSKVCLEGDVMDSNGTKYSGKDARAYFEKTVPNTKCDLNPLLTPEHPKSRWVLVASIIAGILVVVCLVAGVMLWRRQRYQSLP